MQDRINCATLILIALVALGGQASVLQGSTLYTITAVDVSAAVSINSMGQVVGKRHVWTPVSPNSTNGTSVPLPIPAGAALSGATDINDYGQVVGTVSILGVDSKRYHQTIIWTPSTPNGTSFSITLLSGIGSYTSAHGHAINNMGQVVGRMRNDNASIAAPFLWTPDGPNVQTGSMVILQDPKVASFWGDSNRANGINEHGQVTGMTLFQLGNVTGRPFLWTPDAPNQMTGTLSNLPYDFLNPKGINDSGQIVGQRNYGGPIASTWIPTTPSYSHDALINLSDGQGRSLGINSQGDVVGVGPAATSGERPVAFIWNQTDGYIDLNSLLDEAGSGWRLNGAESINDFGQIVGWANGPGSSLPVGSGLRSFLLTPIPEPATAALLTAGAVLLLFRQSRRLVSEHAPCNN